MKTDRNNKFPTLLLQAVESNNTILYVLIILLLFPAVYYNLGLMPLIPDEGIRGLVGLEMILNNDYLTPRLGGLYYHNKPPLYNWFIVLGFKLTGAYNELTIRSVMTIFLLLYMVTIFLFVRKQLGNKLAFISALSFFTCGRVLIYDSMLGLIDICFSWLTFIIFMVIYHYHQKKQYFKLFLLVYLLSALTFLMKGMPSIAFTGISLLVFFIKDKNFRKLFNIWHFVGIFLFSCIIGSYYLFYFLQNTDRTFEDIFLTLFTQSSKRTPVEFGFGETVLHLLSFPFEYIYHFLPWTILAICFFSRKSYSLIKEHPFIRYCILIFVPNIILYWTSPRVYPRYLFMFVPLINTVLFYLYEKLRQKNSVLCKIPEIALLTAMMIVTIAPVCLLFHPVAGMFNYVFVKSVILFFLLSVVVFLFLKIKSQRLLLVILFLVIARIGFNMFVLEYRHIVAKEVKRRGKAVELGHLTRDKQLYIYSKPKRCYLQKEEAVDNMILFYITAERMKPLSYNTDIEKDAWYLVGRFSEANNCDTILEIPYSKVIPVIKFIFNE